MSGYTEYYICCAVVSRGAAGCRAPRPFCQMTTLRPWARFCHAQGGVASRVRRRRTTPLRNPFCRGDRCRVALRGCCRLRPSCRAATLPASPQRAHQYFCCCWHSNPAASARQRSQPAPKLLQLCATRDFAKSIFPPSLSLALPLSSSRTVCVCNVYIPMCLMLPALFCLLETGKSTESASFFILRFERIVFYTRPSARHQ